MLPEDEHYPPAPIKPHHFVLVLLVLLAASLVGAAVVQSIGDRMAASRWASEPACEVLCWPPARGDDR